MAEERDASHSPSAISRFRGGSNLNGNLKIKCLKFFITMKIEIQRYLITKEKKIILPYHSNGENSN